MSANTKLFLGVALLGAIAVGTIAFWPESTTPDFVPDLPAGIQGNTEEGPKQKEAETPKREEIISDPAPVPKEAQPPIKEACALALPDAKFISLSSQSKLERITRKTGESDFWFTKRLVMAERRVEKNRLIHEYLANGDVHLTKVGTPNWDKRLTKDAYEISVSTREIDGEKWSLRVCLSPTKHQYLKNLTDYCDNLSDELRAKNAREFNSLSAKERQTIQQQIAEINAAKRAWVAERDGPEKAKLAEKFFSISNHLDPKWYHLTIRKGVASSQ